MNKIIILLLAISLAPLPAAVGAADILNESLIQDALTSVRGSVEIIHRAELLRPKERKLSDVWEIVGTHRFDIPDSFERNQGLATDGQSFWYSSSHDLMKAPSVYANATTSVFQAIPANLRKIGCNHIGDIDYAGGRLYVSVEDEHKFRVPVVVTYDAETLKPVAEHRLSAEPLRDGLPWVAVDAESGRAFSSQFTAAQINSYDLSTMAALPPILLSRKIAKIQGAKVLHGIMYLTSDDSADRAVYTVNLANGSVHKIIQLSANTVELEGLALLENSDGLHLYVLSLSKKNHHTILSSRMMITDYKRSIVGIGTQ